MQSDENGECFLGGDENGRRLVSVEQKDEQWFSHTFIENNFVKNDLMFSRLTFWIEVGGTFKWNRFQHSERSKAIPFSRFLL